MLELKEITKDYPVGDEVVKALRGVTLSFRESEFVSVLGPSGCGKTTLLNIIGGLDQYTSGDLVINQRSTKQFSQHDWDAYRNHSIGFVFQSYNLIPHQTVLRNVELALTLSGVSKSERRKRAIEALKTVGLGDQLSKKPNQMSGGQMQRVAIARALVNDPDILLADEPTGALDTGNSVQIMELLREVSKKKLVIMVTHNPDLAEQYSTRIIRLLDGKITDDTDPYQPEPSTEPPVVLSKKEAKKQHTSMSFFTALSLSLNNLMTKKTRTFLTAFAGSIGIIGIALILSLSNGVQEYIDRVQEETLSTYPITIESQTIDMSVLLGAMMGVSPDEQQEHDTDNIYSSNIMTDMFNTLLSEVKVNDLRSFKQFLDNSQVAQDAATDIKYTYNISLNVFKSNTEDGIVQVNPSTMLESMWTAMGMSESTASEASSMSSMAGASSMNVWTELLDNADLLDSQYEVVAGKWPTAANEIVLIVSENNEITDYALYSLGLKSQEELETLFKNMMVPGASFESKLEKYTYEELLNLSYTLALPADYYSYNEMTETWDDMSKNEAYMKELLSDRDRSLLLDVVGIIRPREDAVATSANGTVGYTHALTEYVIEETNKREIVKQQLAAPEVDVFTGLPFETDDSALTMEEFQAYMASLSEEERAQTVQMMQAAAGKEELTEEEMYEVFAAYYKPEETNNTYDLNITKLGYADLLVPYSISIYPKDFESKDRIVDLIADYNKSHSDESQIEYTDYIELLMSSISTIINAITYILTAFVAISLVVSSIMIGIITYISVLERTKEIGILRAIGASKKDVSRVFNAETMIVGFAAGLLGIGVTVLLDIPINIIIKHLTDISNMASLPVLPAIVLIVISILLTLIGGLIPAKLAAKKDPVAALRSE
ncbi:MAG: ABC transporter ATP-binding protein/permease [Lachnospiraceae bacterium]|nr:ABC transporter ATP-binding protein/permease [Lachnospiraceae bacterium]